MRYIINNSSSVLIHIYLTFNKRKNKRPSNFYKLINEISTILIIIIILFVVLNPDLG